MLAAAAAIIWERLSSSSTPAGDVSRVEVAVESTGDTTKASRARAMEEAASVGDLACHSGGDFGSDFGGDVDAAR